MPPGGVYTHVSGIDMVRTGPDEFYVLEDNCRTPSGVSYMLENREAMMRLFPNLCARHKHRPRRPLPRGTARDAEGGRPGPCGATRRSSMLTPGAYNSAYYEHCFLADEMGVELVEGADLW